MIGTRLRRARISGTRTFCALLLIAGLAPAVLYVPRAIAPALAAAPAAAPQQERGLRAVEVGFAHLLDRYAHVIDPAVLLQAAWLGALESAPAPQRAAAPGEPLAGDREAVWAAFRVRFDALVNAGGDADTLAQAANRAMARSLDDCHTRFAADYERELRSFQGPQRYGGIGATALDASRFSPPPPGPVIVNVDPDGPAAQYGLRAGDAIVAVDGTDVSGWQNARVTEMVRGTPGETVRLLLDRPGEPAPLELAIERAEIQPTLVESHVIPMDGSGVSPAGYVRLKEFKRPVEPLLPEVLDSLHAQGARIWVLDLRNNGGGAVDTFARVASLFIEEGTLGVTVDRDGGESHITATRAGHRAYTRPMAVLVNSLSASASELLAAGLQEYGIARVFGETTAGCFGSSSLFRLPDGTAMWITVRALQSGLERRDVHKLGVQPDEQVVRTRDDLATGRDPQLEAALSWLTSEAQLRAAAGQ